MKRCSCLAVALLALSAPALAVIKVDLPVSKIYGASKAVLVGTVTAANPDNRVADVKVDEALKGQAPGEKVRIQVATPPGLFASVAVGQPAAVFAGEDAGKAVAVVHIADTWLLAEGIGAAPASAWRVIQTKPDAAVSFPGTTRGLVALVRDIKAGKVPAKEEYPDPFVGGAAEAAKLPVQKPAWLITSDVNGDKRLDLIVGGTSPSRVYLFLAAAKGYSDATDAWGLAGINAAFCAAGDVNGDGKPDLLLGTTLYLNTGDKLAPAKAALPLPPESEWLACALADATGDKRADALVLLKSGKLLLVESPGGTGVPPVARQLWEGGEAPLAAAFSPDWSEDGALAVLVVRESGVTRYEVGGKGGKPADFERLTGAPFSAYKGLGGKPLKPLIAVAFDYDGNEKADYLVLTEAGGLTLINRGYGSFLLPDASHTNTLHMYFHPTGDKKLPFTVADIAAAAPGRIPEGPAPAQNLLVLLHDGRLFEMSNVEK
ncbi:MAG TPA: VCBS repeat-containing protein [Planctomycetota bacterium]|nr:VCBS repeat-containing protein [Planctomycetota bacterium]HRR79944.1 VCBS repeat-containing protein [Planctomycetota bacterium]HRT95367.1 VCBS repeat-containing protein [Planctomycetota bacterium]